MARKLEFIYNQIIAAKEAQTQLQDLSPAAGENFAQLLTDLSSTSRVAIWRLWAYIAAFFIWTHEKLNDLFMQEIEELAATKQVPTLKWYQATVLGFLYGKPIIWDDVTGTFSQELLPTDDEDALKIVKYCATVKTPGSILVKVATDNGGVPGTLTAPQEAALLAFIEQFQAAGDTIEIVNNTADDLNIVLNAYVDPLVIDITTGELLAQPGVKPVEDAIDAYLLNQNRNFNGRFVKNDFIDTIRDNAEGVDDIHADALQHKYAALPYTDIVVSVVPDAGYFIVQNLTINYLPAEL